MADTKKWKGVSRAMRKGIKRSQRRRLKTLYARLTPEQRRKFLKSDEPVGIVQFVANLERGEE